MTSQSLRSSTLVDIIFTTGEVLLANDNEVLSFTKKSIGPQQYEKKVLPDLLKGKEIALQITNRALHKFIPLIQLLRVRIFNAENNAIESLS